MLESSDFIIDSISLFVTRKEFILVLVLYKRGGNTLLFFIGVHIETKKLLKRFDFLSYCLKCKKKNKEKINPRVSKTSNGKTMLLSK